MVEVFLGERVEAAEEGSSDAALDAVEETDVVLGDDVASSMTSHGGAIRTASAIRGIGAIDEKPKAKSTGSQDGTAKCWVSLNRARGDRKMLGVPELPPAHNATASNDPAGTGEATCHWVSWQVRSLSRTSSWQGCVLNCVLRTRKPLTCSSTQMNRSKLAVIPAIIVALSFSGWLTFRIYQTAVLPPRGGLPEVGLTQFASHPSLDDVRRGVLEGLSRRGFRDGETIQVIFRNANGDGSLALPIAQDFVRRRVAVIIPITTPSALAAARSTDSIPIVFGGVTMPERIGLVNSLERPGANVTGTSDRWPFGEQLQFFKVIYPPLQRLGVLYKPGDDVSAFGLSQLEKVGSEVGVKIVPRAVSGAADIYPSAVALLREADALYTGMDNLVVENIESLLRVGGEAGKPIFAGDEGGVHKGALATVSVSMFDLGVLTGEMAAEVLRGRNPGNMPVQVVTEGRPLVNRPGAKQFQLDESKLATQGVTFVGGEAGHGTE